MVKGKYTSFTNHFQTLNWLLLELERTKYRFIELSKQSKKKAEVQGYCYLAACAEAAWQKCEKYYVKADDTAAYYIAIVLNLMLKMQWFHNQQAQYKEKAAWILKAEETVRELQLKYKGKSFILLLPLSTPVTPQLLVIREKIYTFT